MNNTNNTPANGTYVNLAVFILSKLEDKSADKSDDLNTLFTVARGKLVSDYLTSTLDAGLNHVVLATEAEDYFQRYLRFAEYLMMNTLIE